MAPSTKKNNSGFGQPAPVDEFREIKSHFDKLKEPMRRLEQHLIIQEQAARQPRLAMEEADGHANTKTRERTEGAAIAVQAIHGDSCTTSEKVQDRPKTSISFGVIAEPPDLPCREDVLVEDGGTSPGWCLPSLEMRSPTAAGGLLPTGKASTATRTTSNEPLLRFYVTEEMNPEEESKKENVWTSIPSAWYDISFWKLLPALSGLRVIETKPMQNRTFDPDGSQGPPCACPFWGS